MLSLLIALPLLAGLTAPVYGTAEESQVSSNEIGFYCAPIFPENQREEKGYFDLLMEPGQEQDLFVTVVNTSGSDLQIEVSLANAATSPNGEIDYSNDESYTASIPYPFTNFAVIDEPIVTIPTGESTEVKVTVKMPEKRIDGVVLGGIRILRLLDENAEDQSTADEQQTTTSIVNRYQYAYAVALAEDADIQAEPSFSLDHAVAQMMNSQPAIVVDICNQAPMIVKELEIYTRVYLEGEKKPVLTNKTKDYSMAPNSTMSFPIYNENRQGFSPGNYMVSVELKYAGRSWVFAQDFEVTPDLSERMNREAVYPPVIQHKRWFGSGSSGTLLIWVIILLAVAVLVIAVLVMLKIKRTNQEYERFILEKTEQ